MPQLNPANYRRSRLDPSKYQRAKPENNLIELGPFSIPRNLSGFREINERRRQQSERTVTLPSGKTVPEVSYAHDDELLPDLSSRFDKIREGFTDQPTIPIPFTDERLGLKSLGLEILQTPYEVLRNLSSPSSFFGGVPGPTKYEKLIRRASKEPIIDLKSPTTRPEQKLLPPARDPYIAGPGGIQRQSLITPQEEARLAGYEVGLEGPIGRPSLSPPPRFTDLDELREAERIKRLSYTGHEQAGGTSLTVPNKPIIAAPPVAGDTRLGFEGVSRSDLPYPINIAPESVRPRSMQEVTRSLAGDDFARPIAAAPKTTFGDELPVKLDITPPKPKDPTRAIEPGEVILPSAKKTARVIKQKAQSEGLPPEPMVKVLVDKKTPEPVKKAIVQFSKKPSYAWVSGYSQLEKLGPTGKELAQRVQRMVQGYGEYDAQWTEPLVKQFRKLNADEFRNLGNYVEGTMPIPNARVQKAVDLHNQMKSLSGDEAVKRSLRMLEDGKLVPFRKIEKDYWPRYPVEDMTTNAFIERLVAGGPGIPGIPRNVANKIAKRFADTGEVLIGPQHARSYGLFKYRTDADVSIIHGRSMSRRIAMHRELGPKDVAGRGDEGVSDLIESTTDPILANSLVTRMAGRDGRADEKLMNYLNAARKSAAITSLWNFTAPNILLGQASNAQMAISSGHPLRAAKEVFKLFSKTYRDEVRAAGVYNSFNASLAEELGIVNAYASKLRRAASKATDALANPGLSVGERINRGIGAAIGRAISKAHFQDLKLNPNDKVARAFLERLISRPVTPELLAKEELPKELERFAAGRFAEITQGLNVPGNIPYGWSDPVMSQKDLALQLALIFKKVGFQVTKNVKETVKANPKVAIPSWMALSVATGEAVGDVKEALRGVWTGNIGERIANRGKGLDRIADNVMQNFMLGLPWDMLRASTFGPLGLASGIVGPVIGKTSELLYNMWQAIPKTKQGKLGEYQGDPNFKPLMRQGIKSLPIPGKEGLAEELLVEDEGI